MKQGAVRENLLSPKRINVAVRTLIAVLLGYAFSAWLSTAIANFIDATGREHEVLVRMLFFVIYCTFILVSFAVESVRKTAVVMVSASLIAFSLCAVSGGI